MKKVLSMILVIAMALSLGVAALATYNPTGYPYDPQIVPEEALVPAPGSTTYTVQETYVSLASIAEAYLGNANRWPEIWARNRSVLGNVNAMTVLPQYLTLTIPAASQNPLVADHGKFYIIQKDDTPATIAQKVWGNDAYDKYIINNAITQALVSTNRLLGKPDFNIGDEIYIPMIYGVPSLSQISRTYGYRYFEIWVYTVKAGDTLESIAKAVYGDAAYWTVLYGNNQNAVELALEESPRSTVALSSTAIKAGDVLFVPMVPGTLPRAMNYNVLERVYVRLLVQVTSVEAIMLADGNSLTQKPNVDVDAK